MTQDQLARSLPRAHWSQVSRWERGETIPAYDTLVAVAAIFDVKPGWLEWGDEQEEPPALEDSTARG